jgi:phosphate/sulfate permease
MDVPWRTLCGTAITVTALCLGYDGQLALVAVCALLGVELFGQTRVKSLKKAIQNEEETDSKTGVLEETRP